MTEILVCDDHSKDATYLVGLGYKQLMPDLPLPSSATHQLRLRGQPEGRLPVGHRARPRHRGPAPRRRPVRSRNPRPDRGPARAGRVRRGLRLADAGPGFGSARRHAVVQVRRQPHPDHGAERAGRGRRSRSGTAGIAPMRSRRSRDPVPVELRRIRVRHRDHHPAASSRESASSRFPSRPITATRSVTSTGWATPAT